MPTASVPATEASAIEFRTVSFRYGSMKPTVVHDLTFDIAPGEIVALVGPSGCGKTTCLRMINRLLEPSDGEIRINGQPTSSVDPTVLRRGIGYVIQNGGLFPHRTVGQNIGTVPQLLGWSQARIKERTAELLHLVGLQPEFSSRYPAQLSGGQQQRVGVARALAASPSILLMDEPFSAVDPHIREQLQTDLLALQRRLKPSTLVVTHDLDEAVRLGDRVMLFRPDGTLAAFTTPDDLLRDSDDPWVDAFLGKDKALRRLANVPLEKFPLLPVASAPATHLTLKSQQSGRNALNALIAHGLTQATVQRGNGPELLGIITLDILSDYLRSRRNLPSS